MPELKAFFSGDHVSYIDGNHVDAQTAPTVLAPECDRFLDGLYAEPPSSLLTPVHPLESIVRHGYVSPSFRARHAGWSSRRRRIYDAMVHADCSPNRAARFAHCGAGFWVLRKRDDHDTIKLVPDTCHDRFCEVCGNHRQHVIRTNLKNRIEPHPHRFLTLTLKNDGVSLSTLLDKLLRCFKRLRASTFWREKVRGGAAFIELSANQENGRWHPHLHAIVDGKFMDHETLRRLWLSITGDSFVLDIRLIRDPKQVANYITKYATKPLPAKIVDRPYLLEEAIAALVGRKLCYTFGTWSRWSLLKPLTDEDWETFCHANELPFHMTRPNDYATRIHRHVLDVLEHDGPTTFDVTTAE